MLLFGFTCLDPAVRTWLMVLCFLPCLPSDLAYFPASFSYPVLGPRSLSYPFILLPDLQAEHHGSQDSVMLTASGGNSDEGSMFDKSAWD